MKRIINFIQEILMINNNDNTFIGLSSFKYSKAPIVEKKPEPKKNEVKISDLMRKSY